MRIQNNAILQSAVACTLLGLSYQAPAQEVEHTVTGYFVGAAISGTAGAGPLDAEVDVGFSDILENFDGGIMLAYRGERGPWSLTADFVYLGLEAEEKGLGPLGRTRVEIEADQVVLNLVVGHALNEHWSAYGGARYWDLDADVSVTVAEENREASAADSWVDPVVGLRYAAPLGGQWSLLASADIGGFGVGSDFSWSATALAAYSFRPNAHLLIGYRHFDVDYEDGEGADRFKWDVWEGGPSLGIAWQF